MDRTRFCILTVRAGQSAPKASVGWFGGSSDGTQEVVVAAEFDRSVCGGYETCAPPPPLQNLLGGGGGGETANDNTSRLVEETDFFVCVCFAKGLISSFSNGATGPLKNMPTAQ